MGNLIIRDDIVIGQNDNVVLNFFRDTFGARGWEAKPYCEAQLGQINTPTE